MHDSDAFHNYNYSEDMEDDDIVDDEYFEAGIGNFEESFQFLEEEPVDPEHE